MMGLGKKKKESVGLAVHARPQQRMGDEPLLHTLAEDVLEAIDLRLLVEDGDQADATAPERPGPLHALPELLRDVGLHVAHECREARAIAR